MKCCGSNVEDSVLVVAVAPSAQQQEASVAKNRKESRLTAIDDQQQQIKQRPEETPSQEPISDRRVEREVETDHSATVKQGQSTINPNKKNMSITATSRSQHSSARDSSQNLGSSLKEAWSLLVADNPDAAEANEIQRAIELSLLDCALVYHPSSNRAVDSHQQSSVLVEPPHVVLGVSPDATMEQIKAAYRKLVIKTHPDKPGGCRHEFAKVVAAYRSLLATTASRRTNNDAVSVMRSTDDASKNSRDNMSATTITALKSTAHWDAEIKSHWDLVNELFANHDTSVDELAAKQQNVRSTLGLKQKEAGASNRNEQNELIRNSCFYLSLAVSYLNGIGALMCHPFETTTRISITSKMEGGDEQEMLRATDDALISHTALQLKRTIEAAVIKAHPEWARAGFVGEEVQAFSDFLVYTLESDTILRDWAVAIFDETSGFVDVYKGRDYGGGDCNGGRSEDDWTECRSNTLTLRFVPGHYQPLLPLKARPTLDEILTVLDKEGVMYVVTDGSA